MAESLIPILIAIILSAAIIFFGLERGFKFPTLWKARFNRGTELSGPLDLKGLNCRVQLAKQKEDNQTFDVFIIEICGSIHARTNTDYTAVQVTIVDVTDGIRKAKPVRSRVKKCQEQDSPVFCYNTELGRVGNRVTTLADWAAVAALRIDSLWLPRKGIRNLQFNVSILSRDSAEVLAGAKCTFTYQNASPGYIDLEENIQRAKNLAVTLAFAVAAADNKLYNCEVELIKNWARNNIDLSQAGEKDRRRLEKTLNKAVDFFHNGNQVNTYKICKEIVGIVPVAERYDIMDLCLRVAQANGVSAAEELALLKCLASWLEVDENRFRRMMGNFFPACLHETEDEEIILGINSNMSKEQTRQHLNQEYRKWNARVTNSDPQIQTQADYMLKFIAEARNRYLG